LNILFVIDSLGTGGAERQLVELVRSMDKTHFQIHIACLAYYDESYAELLNGTGVRIEYFSRSYYLDIKPIISLIRYIQNNKIDLIHGFMHMGSLFGLIAAKIMRKPIVCSAIRDAKEKTILAMLIIKWLAMFSDIIVANSKAGFTNRFRKMRSNFIVVYNGIDFNRFIPNENKYNRHLREELGLRESDFVVGMVANLGPNKDHITLLDSAQIVLKRKPNVKFLLIGKNYYQIQQKLELKAKQLNIEKNICFCGYRKDIDKIYNIFNLSILLTNNELHQEGISNAIIESMACGIPVIATVGGGTGEIITDGVNGLLIPPKSPKETADAIIRLVSNRAEASRIGEAGKQFVYEKFNITRYVKDYEHLYQKVLRE